VFCPKWANYAVEAIASIISKLLRDVDRMTGESRTVKVVYRYESRGDSLDPQGIFPLGTEMFQRDLPYCDMSTTVGDATNDHARMNAKALIEQSGIIHPNGRYLVGIGLQFSWDDKPYTLIHGCRWSGDKSSAKW
jgi:hypothetical protein